ncbi:MAG: response regulator transcription factor [Polyangia bacterium]
MAKIVLIDDEQALLDVLALTFEDAGHEVITAHDGSAGLQLTLEGHPDLVVSDVNMPIRDGFWLCKELRTRGSTVPIILLTARDNEIDEALGLELGADDYVAKPFSTRVLLARVTSLLRRQELRQRRGPKAAPLTLGHLQLFADSLEVYYRGHPVTVTVTEFRLLDAIAGASGAVLSRDRLLAMVRDDNSVVAVRIIDTYVRRIRRKLEAIDPEFDEIETVVGAGYRWRARSR